MSDSDSRWEGDAPRGAFDERAAAVVRTHLTELEIAYEEESPGSFSFALPGERKLQIPLRIDIGPHALGIHAFVCRNPDENHERVYRWLLERNLRLFAVAFAVDASGDIYLDARLPLTAVTPGDLDALLGSVLTYADESFNTLLELGFASAIRKEWEWRTSKGESTANLEAFRGWLESGDEPKID
ncbi:YbjN domain-containing protein [Nocardioides gilvus]|uniref:YbjN domain-containing protein n=1 Tax=Nocardioides gilvus TaxID=1735589 RepID=UPI000D74C015|nr:YbjN domain-containing protein [Nocardioides gilvus]